MTPAEIKALVERLEEAMSRAGKPRGDHMTGPYALAVASLESGEEGGAEMASVYDTASRCIANETAMFKALSLSLPKPPPLSALRSFMDGGWRPIETFTGCGQSQPSSLLSPVKRTGQVGSWARRGVATRAIVTTAGGGPEHRPMNIMTARSLT